MNYFYYAFGKFILWAIVIYFVWCFFRAFLWRPFLFGLYLFIGIEAQKKRLPQYRVFTAFWMCIKQGFRTEYKYLGMFADEMDSRYYHFEPGRLWRSYPKLKAD